MRTPVTAVEIAKFTLQTDFKIQGPGREMYEASKIMARALVEAQEFIERVSYSEEGTDYLEAEEWLKKYRGSDL